MLEWILSDLKCNEEILKICEQVVGLTRKFFLED